MPHVSFYVQLYIVLAGVFTAGLLAIGLRRAGARAGVLTQTTRILGLGIVYLVGGSVLAFLGIFTNYDSMPPRGFFLFLVCILLIVLLSRSRAFAKLLAAIPVQTLFEVQTFRFLAEILIFWLILEGAMPASMSFTGRNFDILVPLTAPIVAYLLFRKPIVSHPTARWIAIAWNLIGMAILSVTVCTGILSLPTPMRVFHDGISTGILFAFPFHILPAFWVPLAFSLHVFTLLKLSREHLPQSGGENDESNRSTIHKSA